MCRSQNMVDLARCISCIPRSHQNLRAGGSLTGENGLAASFEFTPTLAWAGLVDGLFFKHEGLNDAEDEEFEWIWHSDSTVQRSGQTPNLGIQCGCLASA